MPLSKVPAFQSYLTEAANAVGAIAICEELTAEGVAACGHDPMSVAGLAAKNIGARHAFCEPAALDRKRLGLRSGDDMVNYARELAVRFNRDFSKVYREEVRKQFPIRENFWLSQLESFEPNKNSLVFVFGADHSQSFANTARISGMSVTVYCEDWTALAEIPCPCCL